MSAKQESKKAKLGFYRDKEPAHLATAGSRQRRMPHPKNKNRETNKENESPTQSGPRTRWKQSKARSTSCGSPSKLPDTGCLPPTSGASATWRPHRQDGLSKSRQCGEPVRKNRPRIAHGTPHEKGPKGCANGSHLACMTACATCLQASQPRRSD